MINLAPFLSCFERVFWRSVGCRLQYNGSMRRAFPLYLNILDGCGFSKLSPEIGPRWFQYCFLPALLGHCQGDMMGFFTDFHARGVFQNNLNATLLSLIPKTVISRGIRYCEFQAY